MKKKLFLFNKIAKIYGLFFKMQVKGYRDIFYKSKEEFNFSEFKNVIDVGCGTGALCKVLQEYNLQVTGLEPAEAMLEVAKKKTSNIQLVLGDVLDGLPFEEKSFDIAISSYVAHGLDSKERLILYREMKRVASQRVVILDYNQQRSLMTDFVEWLEGGDYLNFIMGINKELIKEFGNLKVINTGKRSAMYICEVEWRKDEDGKRK